MERLSRRGRKVLMVGDGVNDALAISKAAVEAADITLAGDDLEGLLVLRLLSRESLRTTSQNFRLANLTNAAGIIAGFSGWLPPVAAGILNVGHTLGIMVNSSRLLNWESGRTESATQSSSG